MAILKSTISYQADGIALSLTELDYAKDTANLGRLTNRTRTHYANDGSGDSFVTTETFSCTDDATLQGALLYEHTINTFDKRSKTNSFSRSRLTNRLWKKVDVQGVTETFGYDGLGRVTERVLAAGSVYETKADVDHVVTGGTDEAFQLILADGNSQEASERNKICKGLDAAGRLVYVAINSADDGIDGANYKTQSYAYDALGRRAKVTSADWLLDPETPYSVTETIEYDPWGEPFRVDRDDGSYDVDSHDPIRLTALRKTGGSNNEDGGIESGQAVTTYDANKHPIQVARFAQGVDVTTAKAYSSHTMTYDGLLRLRSTTDEAGKTTSYEYDGWGRLIKTTLPDTTDVEGKVTPGAVITRTYRPDSRAKDVVEIKVNGRTVGSRQFDGLGRLKSATIGGRPWQYDYDSDSDVRPTTATAPDGVVRAYTYVSELGNKVQTLAAPSTNPSISQAFDYYALGALKSASEGSAVTNYAPHSSGRLKAKQQTFDGIASTATYGQYTVGGKIYRYGHVDGAVQTINRDGQGRAKDISDGSAKVTLHRDPAGRLIGWTTEDLTGNNHLLDVQLQLDDYGREVSRTLFENGAQQWRVELKWNNKDLLTERTTYQPTSQYREETFAYDECNRLVHWTCTGALPSDRYGNAMQEQKFFFDSFNNVTKVVTTFDGGAQNIATFSYGDAADPCKLVSVANTHASYPPSATLQYDAAGRITHDGMGQVFSYDALGRMNSVESALTGASCGYAYDAHNRIYKQTVAGKENPIYLYYKADKLINIIRGTPRQPDSNVRMLCMEAGCASQYVEQHGAGAVWLTGSDFLGSALTASAGSATDEFSYSPYGEERPVTSTTSLGYTGQYRDPVLPGYQLGHGYRAYLPALMRFTTPDSESPFGRGGINSYAYCAGDPINSSDPTGHGPGLLPLPLRIFGSFFSNIYRSVKNGLSGVVRWVGRTGRSVGEFFYDLVTGTRPSGDLKTDMENSVPDGPVNDGSGGGEGGAVPDDLHVDGSAARPPAGKFVNTLPAMAKDGQQRLFHAARLVWKADDELPRIVDGPSLESDGPFDVGASRRDSIRSDSERTSENPGDRHWYIGTGDGEFSKLTNAHNHVLAEQDSYSSSEFGALLSSAGRFVDSGLGN